MYPLLLTEVSDQKDMHHDKRIRGRARKRTAEIRKWLAKRDEPIRKDVFLHVEGREPWSLLDELGLDRRVRDDRIIAHAVAYQREGKAVSVVTADFGLELKLGFQGVRVVVLPDGLLLSPEPDPEKQRADKAEAELKAMKNRQPAFEIGTASPLVLVRQKGYGDVEAYVQKCLDEAEGAYQREQAAPYGGRTPFRADSIFDPRYQDYREAAAHYLRARHHWLTQIEGAMSTQLVVKNTGNQTATQVRLRLSFPEEIVPFGGGGLGSPPPRVNLPRAFQTLFADAAGYNSDMSYSSGFSGDGTPKVDRPQGSVAFTWSRIPQHDQVFSAQFWAVARGGARLGSSAIEVSILCEEIAGARPAHVPFTVVEEATAPPP